jgi:hypothetical protein
MAYHEGFCDHDNECLGSKQGMVFLDQVSGRKLLKKESVPRIWCSICRTKTNNKALSNMVNNSIIGEKIQIFTHSLSKIL